MNVVVICTCISFYRVCLYLYLHGICPYVIYVIYEIYDMIYVVVVVCCVLLSTFRDYNYRL